MIDVVTYLDEAKRAEFARLRRKPWTDRQLLVDGEWSQTPYHEGNMRFDIAWTTDRRFWALYAVSFPTRIAAVARRDGDEPLEQVAARMMFVLEKADGEYVDLVDHYGEVDRALLLQWLSHYAQAEREAERAKAAAARPPDEPRKRERRPRPSPIARPPAPRPVFLCEYGLNAGVEEVPESAELLRANGVDQLWLVDVRGRRMSASAPSEGELADAARRLLEMSLRRSFYSPTAVSTPGLVSEQEFNAILATIRAEKDRNAAIALAKTSRIVEKARELGLCPEPTGTSGDPDWSARCPGTQHPLLIGSRTETFFCGWCRRKGGPEDLAALVEERRRIRNT